MTVVSHSSHSQVLHKEAALKNFSIPWKMLGPESHFDKVKDAQSATLLKNTLAQVFFCDFYQICQNILLPEYHLVTSRLRPVRFHKDL